MDYKTDRNVAGMVFPPALQASHVTENYELRDKKITYFKHEKSLKTNLGERIVKDVRIARCKVRIMREKSRFVR